MEEITEIQIVPVKPNTGLVAFCSFVLFKSFYCSSIAIFTRPDGTFRLVYPTKKVGQKDINIFHPINPYIGDLISKAVIKKYKEVMKSNGYISTNIL